MKGVVGARLDANELFLLLFLVAFAIVWRRDWSPARGRYVLIVFALLLVLVAVALSLWMEYFEVYFSLPPP